MQRSGQGDAGPPSAEDLNAPAFLAYPGGLCELPVRPDPEDFGKAPPRTADDAAEAGSSLPPVEVRRRQTAGRAISFGGHLRTLRQRAGMSRAELTPAGG